MKTAIVPKFRRIDGEEPDTAAAKWLSSVPDTFTAVQARDAALAALKDASDVVDNVRGAYKGTLPPPPWPATPELQKAIDQMGGARDYFSRVADAKPDAKWSKDGAKAWTALSRAGVELYQRMDDLQQRSANAPLLSDLLKQIPDPSKLIFGRWPVKETAIAAVALYFLVPQVRRFVGRVVGLRAAGRRR